MPHLLLPLLTGILALIGLSVYATLHALRHAPEGREDYEGFHLEAVPAEVPAKSPDYHPDIAVSC
jgi:hypothetical protein